MNYDGAIICGVQDDEPQAASGQLRKWPVKTLRWTLTGSFRQFDDLDAKGAAQTAWGYWSEVCGLQFEYVSNRASAHVYLDVGRIDGPGNTLAYAYLADGTERQKGQLADEEEPWVIASNPPANRLDLIRVLAHEGGHTLGMGHGPNGSLMQPRYSSSIRKPQEWDVVQAQARYGQPVEPEPEPPTTPGGELVIVCKEARIISQ